MSTRCHAESYWMQASCHNTPAWCTLTHNTVKEKEHLSDLPVFMRCCCPILQWFLSSQANKGKMKPLHDLV